MPTQLYFWWLSVVVSLVIFGKMVVKLPDFIKEYRAQKAEDKKQLESYAQLLAKYNASTDKQLEISQKFGINSPELTAAKERSMAIFKEMDDMSI